MVTKNMLIPLAPLLALRYDNYAMPGGPPLPTYLLIIGDALILGVVTLVGFASHGTLETAGQRILTTFGPLLAAWLLIAPHLGVYNRSILTDWRQLWRPFWAMVLAAPLAAFLRGAWLNAPILPVFVVVLGGTSAIALLAWRSIVWMIFSRGGRNDG